ncbi:D-alanine--D-alanine ligase family protein [Desulfonatronovibrio hydrogenovorans]|uniref:D-alanine--D-alanine ligase family protein n=1 Tax=Desulfonatronovibrio hydrogenovorans TaxID=53245 RepID=UPI00048F51D9|nr:D-alanine--D-alanine ligase [Desulfonatronovibrio hydrogenovorans]
MRVLLIAGGWSEEREVSLKGAAQIEKALNNLGHQVFFLDLSPDLGKLAAMARDFDLAFINLHGLPGEDGTIQALLDDIGLPYQGTGPMGSYLALNKALSKQIFRNHHLPTPDWTLITGPNQPVPEGLEFPLVAKPNTGGSSLGMAVLENQQDLDFYLKDIPAQKFEVILEKYITGTELTCAVLDDRPLPPILIQPVKGSFFNYASKYDIDGAKEICPAPVSPELTEQITSLSLKVHHILGLRDYSRTDFLVDPQGVPYILEVNTLPGMTQTSLVPKSAQAAGLDFNALIQRLISMARDRDKRPQGRYE